VSDPKRKPSPEAQALIHRIRTTDGPVKGFVYPDLDVMLEIDALVAQARADAIEECGTVADNYGREAERTDKEYACEMADEMAARIRDLVTMARVA
jgi:hypothetical protein